MRRPHASLAFLLLALAVPACAERPAQETKAGSAAPAAATVAALQFIEDDAPQALAEAKRRNVPIFVEAWAPW